MGKKISSVYLKGENHPLYVEIDKKKLERLLKKNITFDEIGDNFGVGAATIRKRVKEYKLSRQKRADHRVGNVLTREQVRDIFFELKDPNRKRNVYKIAIAYKVARSTINKIGTGERWNSVTGLPLKRKKYS